MKCFEMIQKKTVKLVSVLNKNNGKFNFLCSHPSFLLDLIGEKIRLDTMTQMSLYLIVLTIESCPLIVPWHRSQPNTMK